jgi:hypothetical protein
MRIGLAEVCCRKAVAGERLLLADRRPPTVAVNGWQWRCHSSSSGGCSR